MRQPLRAILRWTAVEILIVQTLGTWLSRQIGWPVTSPASWAVYVLAGREASRHGRLRHAFVAGGAVALVADVVSAARLALKGLDPALFNPESPLQVLFVLFMTLGMALWGGGWGLLGGLIGRLHQRRALLAFLVGIGPVLAVQQLDRVATHPFSRLILWPATLIVSLVPPHNIGTAAKPVSEGTPVHLIAVTLGVVLCVFLYGAIAYALLAWLERRRAHPVDLNRMSA